MIDGAIFKNGTNINARTATWPLDFTVEPLQPAVTFKIYARGQVDNVKGEKAVDTIHGRVVNVDLDVEADGQPGITDDDEPFEENPGGYACVCTNNLTPIKLTLQPTGLPGKLTLSATMGGHRIRVWTNANRTDQIDLPKTWNAGAAIPSTLYVEGITNSATARDVELRLEYDENPQGQSNPLFMCADVVLLTILKIDFKTNELIRPLNDQTLDAETWLTDDTFDKTRITWSITKVEGVDASIDQDGDITYGQGAGIYTVRAESSDLSTCYDEFTLMVLDWVLGAHSNVGDGAPFISGHAWISVTDFSQNPVPVATFGLWPDDHPLIIQDGLNNGDGTDVRVGREPAYGLHNRYFFLNPTEKQALVNYINTVFRWTYWYTCASFAEGSVMAATGEDVDADDYLGFETPREFGSSINQLEATDPTDRINPVNGGNVNSSWVPSSFEGSVHDP